MRKNILSIVFAIGVAFANNAAAQGVSEFKLGTDTADGMELVGLLRANRH